MRSDPATLVSEFLELIRGRPLAEIAAYVRISEGTISEWRNGSLPKYLQERTRQKLEGLLMQPPWKLDARMAARSGTEVPKEERRFDQRMADAARALDALEHQALELTRNIHRAKAELFRVDSVSELRDLAEEGASALERAETVRPRTQKQRRRRKA